MDTFGTGIKCPSKSNVRLIELESKKSTLGVR